MRANKWEKLEASEVLLALDSDERRGLSRSDIALRQKEYGKNVLEEVRDVTILERIFRQFKSPLVSILLIAGVATLALQEYIDSTVIFIALLINVVVGLFQEERASRAFEKLNESQERHATVIRDGRRHFVLTEEVVPGDIVGIESGQYIPADIRLISEKDLLVNEAALTGEWVAVSKDVASIKEDVPLAERRNMVWRGTLVAEGYGLGVVVAIGDKTQVGIIARELGSIEEHITPLQQNIRSIAHFISYAIAGSIGVIFVLGLFRGEPFGEMLLIAIAIAVAAIPSGLPAAVTVVLAIGMEKILKHGGLVRNLMAAETLGATTIILTDKTGTLTEAKMRLAEIYTLDTLRQKGNRIGNEWTKDEREALKVAVLASDAFVEEQEIKKDKEDGIEEQELVVRGRPIEKAILLAGLDAGISKAQLYEERAQIDYLQFESHRRFGGSLNKTNNDGIHCFYITGAPETLFENTPFVYKNGRKQKLTISIQEEFVRMQRQRSEEGMRFIGVAYKEVKWNTIPERKLKDGRGEELLEDAIFLGFLVFDDPIRKDVPSAIAAVKKAGAQVLMVTGDNPETARKIACDVGIGCTKREVKTGADIENCNDEELYQLIQVTKVFARTLPSQKLRIARLLKNKNEIVAMTGDGVNDAPALRSANIGIAVGSGTEVAKEASDMILLNNSFSIIVSAIEEGRRIIDNLKKIVAYLLSTSFSEIFLIGGALAFGAPLPLLPAQILWANIIEEGLMSFSFAFERKSPGIMNRNPRESSSRNIMTPALKKMILIVGSVTGVFLTAIFFVLNSIGMPIEEIRTIMFVTLSLDAIFFSFSLKSFNRPIWKIDLFSNRFLLVALAISVSLLISALILPPIRHLLSLTVLTPLEIVFLFFVGIFNLFTIELVKYFLFERKRRK